MQKIFLLILFIVLICIRDIKSQDEKLLFFKDCDGVYYRNLSNEVDSCLLKINCNAGFVVSQEIDNSILFAVDNNFNESNSIEQITYDCYRYNDEKLNLEGVVEFRYHSNLHELIIKRYANKVRIDTFKNVYRLSNTAGVQYFIEPNSIKLNPLEEEIQQKSLYADRGNVMKINSKDTALIIPNYETDSLLIGFDYPIMLNKRKLLASKFVMDKKNYKIIDEELVLINLKNDELTLIQKGESENLSLSHDKKYVLFTRNCELDDCSKSCDIWIMNLHQKTLKHIGNTTQAVWIE